MFLRVIPPLQTRGAVQMAIDRWLLREHLAGNQPPSLRFYTWEQPTLSLGYHQKSYPPAWDALPITIVRRPTGGRAVLHGGDLTYMVVLSGAAIASKTHREAYCYVCRFLVEGWRSLGRELVFGDAGRGYIHNPSCFGTATGADLITLQGEKFIGSAQLRRGNAILQHGSMLLDINKPLFLEIFGTSPLAPPPTHLDTAVIIETLTKAAGDCFGLEIVSQPLSSEEWAMIAEEVE